MYCIAAAIKGLRRNEVENLWLHSPCGLFLSAQPLILIAIVETQISSYGSTPVPLMITVLLLLYLFVSGALIIVINGWSIVPSGKLTV